MVNVRSRVALTSQDGPRAQKVETAEWSMCVGRGGPVGRGPGHRYPRPRQTPAVRLAGADGAALGELLHVHLGFGRFRIFTTDPPPPTGGTRLALQVTGCRNRSAATLYLAGATIVRLVTPAEAEQVITRLGPDSLHPQADPDRFVCSLARRSITIGGALLDQKGIAGIGNVYRAELLFRAASIPTRLPTRSTR